MGNIEEAVRNFELGQQKGQFYYSSNSHHIFHIESSSLPFFRRRPAKMGLMLKEMFEGELIQFLKKSGKTKSASNTPQEKVQFIYLTRL